MRSTLRSIVGLIALCGAALALGYGIGTVREPGAGEVPTRAEASRRAVAAESAGVSGSGTARELSGDGSAATEIAALRSEVAALRAEVAALAAARVEVAQPVAIESSEAAYDPAEQAEAERERREEMAETERSFWQEPADTPWAREASSTVLDALESAEASKLEVLSLECRTQTCRMEVVQDDAGEATRSLPLLLHRLGPTLPSVTTTEAAYPDGRRGVVLYMSGAAGNSASG